MITTQTLTTERPSNREFVYKIIDNERNYQDSLDVDRVEEPGEPHSAGEYLTMLTTYLRKAQDAWTLNPGDSKALHEIRKIAAIAVRCMEDNGAYPR